MPERFYDVTLLSDLVLSAEGSTVGGHSGQDFLRGSLFLGAVAARMGSSFDSDLLLSGRVRFLNAFPVVSEERTLPVPLSFYKEKGRDWEGAVPYNGIDALSPKPGQQLKQWREGFMTPSGLIREISLTTRMKTAVDRKSRSSREGQLFGYEAIPAGTLFRMAIQADSEDDLKRVTDLLGDGELLLGKSRFAEYGAVRLERRDPPSTQSDPQTQDREVILYLASDLCLCRSGMPVLAPEASDFGLADGTFRLDKSFIHHRRYAPWNSFFNGFMGERQVLCQGSVLVFSMEQEPDLTAIGQKLASGVGRHREEGLGQILVNPAWIIHPPELQRAPAAETVPPTDPGTELTAYLRRMTDRGRFAEEAFQKGRDWADAWSRLGEAIEKSGQEIPGKTQWNRIRELSLRFLGDPAPFMEALRLFCCESLRRKVWTESAVRRENKKISLFDAMAEELTSQPDERALLALHHAAVEMGRSLSRSARQKGGSQA